MNQELDHFVITSGPRAGEKISLATLPIIVGRQAPADVLIDLASLSRQHARVSRGEMGYVIEDLGSQNGTFINLRRIEAPQPLANGDRVHLGGDFEMLLVSATAGAATAGAATVVMRRPEVGGGAVVMPSRPPEPASPALLIVTGSGLQPVTHTITQPRLRIGRNPDNDIVVDNPFVSRYHAELERRGQDYYLIPSSSISNTLLVDGQPVMEPVRLESGAKIRLGGYTPGEIVLLHYLEPDQDRKQAAQHAIRFNEKQLISIGRDKDNAIVLPTPSVSRFHAEVEKVGQRYRVRDLRSSNGTFVNGKRIEGETWIQMNDAIQVGPYRFRLAENELAQQEGAERGVSVDVVGLNKWVNKKLNILQDISLSFKPREFIVIVGQSGGGKSTLMDAISGYRPATDGQVIVNGTIDVYKEYDAIRSTIGYVPQKDIIHMELTVRQALDYAAQLRMPADTTVEERRQRVDEVLDDLDLAHRKDTQISQLSGGQQKRVSIGVELLTKPGLFFLDEPTSGLDPGMETELMKLMRRLADQGRTIVMITHATKNVMLADKVVFLARGGYLAWFGPPEAALQYFDAFRTERERRSSPMAFDYIYTLLDNDELGRGEDWAERFRKHAQTTSNVATTGPNLSPFKPGQAVPARPAAPARPLVQRRQVSALRQFFILSARYMTITARDRFSLILLILTTPLLASLDFVLAYGVGRAPFSFESGNVNNVIVTLIVLNNTCILVGGLAFMRELVKEREIYRRERMVNLRLSSYILSKLWFALVLAIYQATVFTIIHNLAFDMPGGLEERVFFWVTALLLVIAGMLLGLFVSALAPNANSAPLLLILFIIPQMVLSGALVTLPEPIMAIASSNWAFRSVMALTGVGSDVKGDACWALPEEQRDDLTLDEKNAGCQCMGTNALHEATCNFPGSGKFYDAAVDQPDPPKPDEPGPQPEEPVLPPAPEEPELPSAPEEPELPPAPEEPEVPPAPEKPADLIDLLLIQQYLADLEAYNNEVTALQDEYRAEVRAYNDEVTGLQDEYRAEVRAYNDEVTALQDEYRAELEAYDDEVTALQDGYRAEIKAWQDEQVAFRDRIEAYQEEFTELEIKRVIATGSAESSIKLYTDQFGWTWINKDDRAGYLRHMSITWAAQVVIIILLFIATVLLQKQREIA